MRDLVSLAARHAPGRKPLGVPLAIALAATVTGGMADARTTVAARGGTSVATSSMVQVNTGRGRLVTLARPMTDIFVADETIADVQVRSPTQLYIYGKKTGETTISATGKSGAVVYATTVRVGQNIDSIGAMLSLAMPDAQLTATPMNGLVLLTGTVAGPGDAAEAERLVQAYVGDGIKVLSRLRTATPLQVNLQVRVAEVSRSFIKNVGVNLQSFDNSGGFQFGIGQGRGAAQYAPGGGLFVNTTTASAGTTSLATGAAGSTIALAGKLLGVNLLSAIDLGETTGQVTTLANPNLTALSGETATFLAGGEIPIPIAQGLGAVSVEYKQYGVSLAYTPTVLSDGRISLRVRPEVSQLDYSNAVQLNGTRVPGITSRRAETTLELGSGQSMMIGGLLQNSHNNNIQKTPFLGDLPIIGSLFRSNGFQRNETELVIIITPYLVKPVNSPSQIALPHDGYRAPDDASRILLGELGSGGNGPRPVPTMIPGGPAPMPTIGAAAPVPALPRRDPPVAADTRSTAKKKGALPAPGFSN
ncbi:type II and III secretion system protein family protein [Sphingomonas sp. RP10(2022)]|uniref:Type II and III secretion system protein family protein n=1 Tax=Sphingomonas liriopis TaxID=2949094 RepID=A0A9X2HW02_9SPHN|nr:type II and III secretion system protein family protein [Sphingomonas liriopis]MCP3735201.1 type II and III secretion system protein family protein [Sphingomonas liriopis]